MNAGRMISTLMHVTKFAYRSLGSVQGCVPMAMQHTTGLHQASRKRSNIDMSIPVPEQLCQMTER